MTKNVFFMLGTVVLTALLMLTVGVHCASLVYDEIPVLSGYLGVAIPVLCSFMAFLAGIVFGNAEADNEQDKAQAQMERDYEAYLNGEIDRFGNEIGSELGNGLGASHV